MQPRGVLLCPPDHYRVQTTRNPHTRGPDGAPHPVDASEARRQWDQLAAAYRGIGLDVALLVPDPALPDQVFTANPVFTAPGRFIASRMRYPERSGEVAVATRFLADQGLEAIPVPAGVGPLEGGGDLVWSADGAHILGGHGFRSSADAVAWAGEALDVDTTPLRLVDPRFYHLDTCLCILDEETCITYLPAFDGAGQEQVKQMFPERLELDEPEALRFAANAHCPDQKHLLLDGTCTQTAEQARERGFEPVPLETSEFRKAGGSVYCMKQMLW